MQFFNRPNEIKHLFDDSSIEEELIMLISQAKVSLKIAVTWFTNHNLFNAIVQKFEETNFQITVIVLNDRINNKRKGVDFQKLIRPNGSFYYSDKTSMVHHKFCIIDNKIVATGSYNWTYNAEDANWENIIVLSDIDVVKEYVKEFDRIIDIHKDKKVKNVNSEKKFDVAFVPEEYLALDYLSQAAKEERIGNNLSANELYAEVLKLDSDNKEVSNARDKILSRYNKDTFNVAPCEIGILFNDGYKIAIPALTQLPFISEPIMGYTTSSTARNFSVTILRPDKKSTKIFPFNNLTPQPINTAIAEYIFQLDKTELLTVHCRELNGYGEKISQLIDLKNWC